MLIPDLNFSYNWNNKLNCLSFTTLRLRKDSKYKKGALLNVKAPNIAVFPVLVLDVKHLLISQLTEGMCRIDTGYSKAETEKLIHTMYMAKTNINWEHQQLVWVLLRRLKAEEVSKQEKLF